ncbi:hypothetical protein SDC9_202147 [bioreactor metagenome]|uniref:Uncharacterized protein n=1 Tax=bioreactor metagenome TaxID=1076179 RepID=A0A645ITJ1_9ZZZZ
MAYQLAELGKDLEAYGWFGVGRDDGAEKGEFMAIFYKRDRLKVFKNRFAGNSHVCAIKFIGNRLEYSRNAARIIQSCHRVLARGLEIT